jgi:multisubunit Na+/H+ antiporter MnhB subunit
MNQNLQLALLIVVVILLYVISSRWRPEDEGGRRTRVSYWIGLIVALALAIFALLRSRQG